MTILVTGSNGMIGSHLVKALTDADYDVVGIDISGNFFCGDRYTFVQCSLDDRTKLEETVREYRIDRIIHLAALAHTKDETDLTWERYKHINTECAKNVFEAAGDIPVLYISTVDVYGFTGDTPVNAGTEIHPVTFYGKSKALAEEECRKLKHYDIYRFSPVYTDDIKRDIQKRYYLKYPDIAYQIGKGTEYEILNIRNAVKAMLEWCGSEPHNGIRIIKDPETMKTPEYISAEKAEGRAKIVLHFPKWLVNAGYVVLRAVTGRNKYTYLLNKAVHPLRSE